MILADKCYREESFRYLFLNLSGARSNYSLSSHRESRVGYQSHQILQGEVSWIFLYPSIPSSLDQSGGMSNCNLTHILNPRGDLNSELNFNGRKIWK